MKYLLFFLLVPSFSSFAQNIIEWQQGTQLTLNDFQAPLKQKTDNISFALRPAISIDFSFYMSNYEFMLTKNFNSKVKTTFSREASYIFASDSLAINKLLKYSQAQFDLAELHTRKFRKKMYENKNVLSNPNFYQDLYRETEKEFTLEQAELMQASNDGFETDVLEGHHSKILKKIEELADFCKDCKPKKKKNK